MPLSSVKLHKQDSHDSAVMAGGNFDFVCHAFKSTVGYERSTLGCARCEPCTLCGAPGVEGHHLFVNQVVPNPWIFRPNNFNR